MLFCDTDAFTTAVFHEVYLGSAAAGFDDLVSRQYDAFLVCGLDVPWAHDGIREFEEQRRLMHERYLERAAESGVPWTLLAGTVEERLVAAGRIVELVAPEAAAGTSTSRSDARRS